MVVVINKNCGVMQLAVVYRPGRPGMDWIFMDESDSFTGSFLSRNGKQLICGNFNYWINDPAHNPYSSAFMELLNINNFENHMLRPTYAIDLISSPCDSNVDDLNVLPISSNMVDHDMVIFHANFPKMHSFTDLLHSRNIKE